MPGRRAGWNPPRRLRQDLHPVDQWPLGVVFVAVTHPNRPMALRTIAFGVRHHPPGSNAQTVYEVADRRFNVAS